ncbi:MAG: 4-carboxy-4-hydroxy-2-oxoadipate aldolase/oxaloacetate decarboxylase [Rudaea sp.]|uniref:4-carboxy-4-hydroxy-2-oxoadipate aldolase/oxaloacetate decarboxylase n=1 Tax=unclassified Rudaea TaxID=2627037 RepID=UPI0010FA3A7E|nr:MULTISPECIES: 4-carboxy-4-hydroxy-2-oxoadipate aldolase/oxaloacetate decarboxylase [unclassified Rudaea]MBN8885708.1 4-carboxy-4-hydroxy-2-oxoadipate aldolase/oxaloacetate decarboxylase [Rudaea sp.]MBR0344673.1 4-carboxy-4-hydroxy-2-oxoadipate aldolase/oxaloacetate decarboxylase [Rudaea sp.]
MTTASYPFLDLPTVRADFERPAAALVAAAAAIPVATLHEAAGKIGALPAAIKPVALSFKICGPALTVQSPPADNLWLHRALVVAKPGDVLVVSVSGHYDAGYWGEVMSTMGRVRGLGGLVIDGCVRDGAILEQFGFPVFARGLCIRGTGKDFAARGWINHPLMLDDLVVHAGDLIVGDTDGVVALPRTRIGEIVTASHDREAKEQEIIRRLEAGEASLDIYGWNRG